MTVYVTVGEQNLSCEVRRGDRVSDLKTALHYQQPALHVNQLQLSYKDTVLKDGEYLKEYGIKVRLLHLRHVHAGCSRRACSSKIVQRYWNRGSGRSALNTIAVGTAQAQWS